MAGNRYIPTIFTALDSNGSPLAGAKLYFYENNTTTPKDTYSDIDLTTANQWPVVADGAGRFTDDIFMDTDAYRIKLTDSDDVQIWSKDDCNTFNGAPSDQSFPFPGAVIEFYGTQGQLDTATAAFWYIMDGNNGLPNLDDTYIKACIDVASIGTTGGSNVPTGNADSHVLTEAEIPAHTHGLYTQQVNIGGGTGIAAAPNVGTANTNSTGGGGGHTHTLTMDNYDPPFYQLIKLVYLGY
jgi:hypothetical protein